MLVYDLLYEYFFEKGKGRWKADKFELDFRFSFPLTPPNLQIQKANTNIIEIIIKYIIEISLKIWTSQQRCVCDGAPSSSVRYFLPASYIVPHFPDTSYIQIAQWGQKRAISWKSPHFDNISLLFSCSKAETKVFGESILFDSFLALVPCC